MTLAESHLAIEIKSDDQFISCPIAACHNTPELLGTAHSPLCRPAGRFLALALSVWFDDPKKEHVCEESDDDMILVKDRRGRIIGFERLNFLSAKQRQEGGSLPVEVQLV